MKRSMYAVMLVAGLCSYANADTKTFIPLEIPTVGWSLKYDTANMVKVHKDSNEYICKGTQITPFSNSGGISTLVTTAGTGSSVMQGTCLFITEVTPGKPSVGMSPGTGPAYYLTGKDYFGWTEFTGTTPTNAVAGGTLQGSLSFICRVNLGVEGYKAGLYDPVFKQCTVPFKGTLQLSSKFEVLTFQGGCKR